MVILLFLLHNILVALIIRAALVRQGSLSDGNDWLVSKCVFRSALGEAWATIAKGQGCMSAHGVYFMLPWGNRRRFGLNDGQFEDARFLALWVVGDPIKYPLLLLQTRQKLALIVVWILRRAMAIEEGLIGVTGWCYVIAILKKKITTSCKND